jgi:hypothetical protein
MSGAHPSKRALERFGCTAAEWHALHAIGVEMRRRGKSNDTTPLRAYARQRTAAILKRGISWELTLWQWWTIWQDSGHWHERGASRGYVMCRKGDVGPYAVGNVFIARCEQNSSIGSKKSGLPIGVERYRRSKSSPFKATCYIGGKARHLGVFNNPDDAHKAYLAAVEVDLALRAATPMQRAA